MYVVLGATGHIGSQILAQLRPTGEQLIAVTRSADQAAALTTGKVEAAVVDITDTDALRATFRRARRAFLLNPPGDPSGDSEAAELTTARAIATALEHSGLEKLVLASTYGAQPGEAIGDLSTLHEFERLVTATGIPTAINRGAYYFTNLDMLLDPARDGTIFTAFPPDFALPMVAPADLGRAAASRLTTGLDDTGIQHVEGPARYSFNDVAATFAKVLGHPVEVIATPRDQWEASFQQVGFSPQSARSFARMTAATLGAPDLPDHPRRGSVTLEQYIQQLADSSA